jgi:hypothetical protein
MLANCVTDRLLGRTGERHVRPGGQEPQQMITANPVPAIWRVRDAVSEKEGFHEQSVKRVGVRAAPSHSKLNQLIPIRVAEPTGKHFRGWLVVAGP